MSLTGPQACALMFHSQPRTSWQLHQLTALRAGKTTHQAWRTASAACGALQWPLKLTQAHADRVSSLVDLCWLRVVLPKLLIHIVIVHVVAYPDELLQEAMPCLSALSGSKVATGMQLCHASTGHGPQPTSAAAARGCCLKGRGSQQKHVSDPL